MTPTIKRDNGKSYAEWVLNVPRDWVFLGYINNSIESYALFDTPNGCEKTIKLTTIGDTFNARKIYPFFGWFKLRTYRLLSPVEVKQVGGQWVAVGEVEVVE